MSTQWDLKKRKDESEATQHVVSHLCRPGYPSNILQKAFQIIEDFGVLYTYPMAPTANVNWNFHIPISFQLVISSIFI